MTPSIDWKHFLDNALPSGVRYARAIIVESPGYQRSLEALLRSAEPVELQSYFIWMLIRQLDFLIPPQYIALIFRSSDAPQERSKHCLWAVREDLSGPLTYFYVQKAIGTSIRSAARSMPPHFSPEYPDYVNFGGMGTLMAHEFTKHCFI
ncbi:hypothetical protein BGZ67_003604 [Mortierella alpina]|nr:hypothetical protein BGZ67_003604 [Mortierella alpina]